MEHGALLRCCGQQTDGMGYLVDGRELHLLVAHSIRTASEHVIDADATHERVGREVGLELAVGTAGSKISHTHNLRTQSVQGDGIEDESLSHILRVDVLVAQILSHV